MVSKHSSRLVGSKSRSIGGFSVAKKYLKVVDSHGQHKRSFLRTAIQGGELVLDIYMSASPKKRAISAAVEVIKEVTN